MQLGLIQTTLRLAERIAKHPRTWDKLATMAENSGISGDGLRIAYCLAALPASARTVFAEGHMDRRQLARSEERRVGKEC